MRLNYVIARFTAPFHVGRSGLVDTYDYIPSDTIYSALDWLTFNGVDHGVERVSSAMPMVRWGDSYALPAPMPASDFHRLVSGLTGVDAVRVSKVLKGLRYIPFDCLGREITVSQVGNKYEVLCGGKVVGLGDYGDYVTLTKNVMSRNTQVANIYRIVAYQPIVDYVIYYVGNDNGAFEVLGKLGIGGERTSGLGKFEVVSRGSLEVPDKGKYALLMGIARVREPRGYLNWGVKAWNCERELLGPVSVLLEGSVLEGNINFDNPLTTQYCRKRLDPVVVWLS